MDIPGRDHHCFDLTPKEAQELQRHLRHRVDTRRPASRKLPGRVAGVDVSYDRNSGLCYAVAMVLDPTSGEVLGSAEAVAATPFPYVPGLLSFRELPVLLTALETLEPEPQLVLTDGHGYAHPRRFGLACHLGIMLEVPTIGVAKSRLVGTHDEPAAARGSTAPLTLDGERIGTVLRSRDGVRPVYVSIGHRIDLTTATRWVLACCHRYRLPEPVRLADKRTRELRRADTGNLRPTP